MKPDFAALMGEIDPIDAADWLLDVAVDLAHVTRAALWYSDGQDLIKTACAATRTLEVIEAMLAKVQDGYEGLARPAKRGSWCDQVST